jgi:hypothetical protein
MKSITILDDLYKAIGVHINDKNFLADWGFWFLQGILAGVGTNDVWRVLNLPGEGQPIVIGNMAKELEVDYVFQLIIAGLIIVADLFGLKHGVGFGSGMILGSTWANLSESGVSVTLLPFELEAKR